MNQLRRLLALAVAGLAHLTAFAQSADSALDSAFVAEISPGLTPAGYPTFDNGTGAVNAVSLQSDGKIIAGGNVSRYKASGALTALKRLHPTGALDTSFNSGGAGLAATSGQPEVNALLVDSADRIYVGGTFDSYNGTARSGILRLLADGSLDPDFNLTGLGGGNRFAQALAVQPDGKLLVGGTFASINGNGRSHLARLNSDGTLDFTFTAFSAFSSTFTSSVRDIALLPDGRILIAGLNTASQPVLIRLQANGTLDASFNPGLVAATGAVNKLLLLPDGRVLAAGFFTPSATGQEVDLAAFQADGSLAASFLANLGDGPNGSVLDLELQPDGTILASGVFNLWNGQPRASLARLSLTGELLASPAPAPYTDNRDNENITPFYLTHFYSLAVQPDGKLVAGGWFSRVTDPALETYNLTRFVNEFSASSPGAIRLLSATASTAENAGSVTLQVSRFGGTSGAVSVQFATSTGGSAGTATAGSDYTTTTGTLSWAAGEGGFKTITVPVLQDTASESPETFTVTLSNATGGATVPAANAKTVVTVRDDDSAPLVTTPPASASVDQGARLTLSVGFDSVLPATLRWQRDPDGAGPLGYSDLSDGALISGTTSATLLILAADPALHSGAYRVVLTNSAGSTNSAAATVAVNIPAGSVVTTTSPIVWNRVLLGLALDSAERPLVLTAGLSGSDPAQLRRLVRSTDATPLINIEPNFNTATFTQVSGSLTSSGSPTALLVLPDGKILVGGYFTHVNGSARPTLARFAADGLLDSAYAPALPTVNLGSTITSVVLAPGAGGKFYAGFDTNGGLRRYAADGTLDTGFAPNTNASFFGSTSTNNAVTAILEAPDGKVYVAHRFSTGGFGAAFQYLIWRLNPDGSRDTSFVSPTPNFTVTSLALLPDGRLAFAGLFQSVNSLPLARLAIANPDGSLDAGFFRNPNFVTGVNKLFYRDGRLLVVGEYQNTVTTPRAIARYNLDGTLDSTFAIGEGANGRITGAAFTSSGELLVVGGFSQIKGVSRDRLAYLVMNPQIGAIGFAPSRQITTERTGSLALTLRRYGPATEAASLRWATADGLASDTTATAGQDYTAASGTVSWAAGDSSDKTISIQLLNDSAQEATERFRVLLSAPSGPITAAAPVTVELIDDDTPATFTTQPLAPATLTAGGSLALSGAATSPTPVTYQWFLNGVAIPGATSASYSKNPVTTADGGLYTLVATNTAGSFTSNAALVVIQPQAGRVAPGQIASGRPSFTNGTVEAILALPDGGALVGGSFTQNTGANVPQSYLVRIKPDGSTDTSFTLALNADVRALLRAESKILVAGNFTTVNGVTQRYFLCLKTDLTLDTDFNTNVGASLPTGLGTVTDLALDSEARAYISFNNFSSGGLVRRFDADGLLDAAYNPAATGGGITAIAAQSDNRLVVGGNFTNLAGVSRSRLGRLFADGTLDTSFVPAVGSFPFNDLLVTSAGRIFAAGGTGGGTANVLEVKADGSATVFGYNSGGQVYETAGGPDGRLVLARASVSGSGSLSRVNLPSTADSGNITADTTFSVGAGPNADVRALAYAGDGSLWVAGAFTTFDGFASGGVVKLQGSPTNPGIVNPPARLDANPGSTARLSVGAVGTGLTYQWFKNGVALTDGDRISGATTAVLAISGLQLSDDDTYTVTVSSTTPGSTPATSAPVKINVLGAPAILTSPASSTPALGATVTLAADVLAATPATYVWRRDGVVIQDGGRYSGATTGTLVIAGVNASDNGAYTLTVTNTLGTAATTPATLAAGAFVAAALDPATAWLRASSTGNQLNAILHLPDGRTLVGGTATSAGGAVLDRNGTSLGSGLVIVDQAGNVSSTPAGGFARQVNVVLPLPDGKFLAAGNFSAVNGGNAVNAVRLNADLTRDTAFAPVSTNFTFVAAHGDAQGRVYLGGSFNNYGGQTGQNHLVRLRPDGSLDPDFAPVLNGAVQSIVSLPDGRFYVGGAFTSHSTSAIPAAGLLRFLPDGRVDASFNAATLTAGSPNALAVDAQGRIIVGGAFGIGRLLPSGAVDTTFSSSVTVNNGVRALVAQPNGKILVGGFFTSPANRFFRLNADGTRDTAFDVGAGFTHTSGSNIAVTAIAPDTSGRIWVSGLGFTAYKGVAASAASFAIIQDEAPALAFTRLPTAAQLDFGATLTLSAAANGNNGFTWQWLKNGQPLADGPGISGATTPTLTLSGLAAGNAGDYSVRITSPGGTLTSPVSPLTVGPIIAPPVLIASPTSLTRDLGGSVTFTASARGALPLSYQWFHFEEPLSNGLRAGATVSGATSPSLTLTGLTFANAGDYRVRVTNPDGSATTEPARLTVQRRPGALAAGPVGTTGIGGTVNAILRLADGSMLVGGNITSVTVNGSSTSRARLARFLADGSLDPAFAPTIPGAVRALAQDSAGRVFIAGDFNGSVTVGGVTANRIRVARLTSALVLDTAFDTSVSGPNANINALAPTENGGVYVGGAFGFNLVGTATVNRIARLTATGALDTGFTAATSISNEVKALLRRPDGKLYVGGTFGTQLLNANGTRDTAFTAEGFFVLANAFLLLPDNNLIVAANGASPQNYLRRLNANTGASLADYSAGHSSQVNALARQADGKLLSGSGGVLKRTALDTGTDDGGFGSFNSAINALAVDGAGRIWVGGSFNQYGGVSQGNLAILNGGELESRDGFLAAQTLTFPAIADRTFGQGGNTVTLSATSSAGLTPITFSVTSGPATVSGTTLTITGAGTVTVQAAQAGDATYAAATATRTFTVAKAAQTITFEALANKTIASPAFTLAATASSGLSVSFSVSSVPAGIATLSGNTLTLSGATGTVTVTATQAGNADYAAATAVPRSFEVTAGTPQSINNFNAPANRVATAAPFTVSATATSGLPVSFSVVSGPATISGNTVTLTRAAGTVVIRASQSGGDRNGVTYAPATPVDQSFEVTLGPPTQTQTITFPQPPALTYGAAPYRLVATASSGLPVSFELGSTVPAGIATLSDGVLTVRGAGSVTVRAVQPGAFPFKAATAVSRTIKVNKAPLAVTFASASRLVGQPNPTFTPIYSGFVNGDDTSKLAAKRPVAKTTATAASPAGQYPITFTGGVDANYTFVAGAPAFLTVEGFGGGYEALLVDDTGTPLGKLELLVSDKALTYTGTLNLAAEPASITLRGTLAASDGSAATSTWTRTTAGVAALSLSLEIAGDTLDATLMRNGEPFLSAASGTRLFVQPTVAGKKQPAPWIGAHTLVLRDPLPLLESDARALPLGAGHATANIVATGVLTITGKLADGTSLTTTAKPDINGVYRIFARPYAKRLQSVVAGELALEAHPDQTRFRNRFHIGAGDASLIWTKAALPSTGTQDKSYRAGFEVSVQALLDPWLAPSARVATVNGVSVPVGTLVQRLGLADLATASASVATTFVLEDGVGFGARAAFLPASLNLSATGTFSVPAPLPVAPNNPAFTLRVTPTTGAFSGSFTLSDIPPGATRAVTRTVTVSGTLRQGPESVTATLGHAHFLLDPVPGDTSTELVSGELQLSPVE